MSLNEHVGLFEAILKEFHDHGILKDFILIGSWVLRVYAEYFEKDPGVPIVATRDLDLLVPNPPEVSREVDIAGLLKNYDLEAVYAPVGGCSKFVSPDFEVEFLYPEMGRGEGTAKMIPGFGITATPLRYLNFLQEYTEVMDYKGLMVRVPNPAVFMLMKYLLVKKRKPGEREKIEKDLSTAKDLEFFLLEKGLAGDILRYYQQMPKKWRKDGVRVLEENESELLVLLNDD